MSEIIVFCGPPCSGKTKSSREFSIHRKIERYSVDSIGEVRFGQIQLSQHQRDECYDYLHRIAKQVVSEGRSVVLDATYAREIHRRNVENLARELGVKLVIKEQNVHPEEAKKRFLNRQYHPARDLTIDRVEELAKAYPYGWNPQ